jgi:putative DNA primase/helicase
MNNIEEKFRQAARDVGIAFIGPIIADGQPHRIHIEGHRLGTKNGFYVLHAGAWVSAGYGMDHKTGIQFKWNNKGKRFQLSAQDRATIKADMLLRDIERKIEQERQHEIAAMEAREIWKQTWLITSHSQHQYLIDKQIKPHNARLRGNTLIIPIYNELRQIVNLQRIFYTDNGCQKRFLKGAKKKECFSVIGRYVLGERILICEGWATGASLHENTGYLIFVALDAGNLEPVAQIVRKNYPKAEIVIMGDNDLSNVGQTAAKKAARSIIGGKYLIPPTPGHDWNDEINTDKSARGAA